MPDPAAAYPAIHLRAGAALGGDADQETFGVERGRELGQAHQVPARVEVHRQRRHRRTAGARPRAGGVGADEVARAQFQGEVVERQVAHVRIPAAVPPAFDLDGAAALGHDVVQRRFSGGRRIGLYVQPEQAPAVRHAVGDLGRADQDHVRRGRIEARVDDQAGRAAGAVGHIQHEPVAGEAVVEELAVVRGAGRSQVEAPVAAAVRQRGEERRVARAALGIGVAQLRPHQRAGGQRAAIGAQHPAEGQVRRVGREGRAGGELVVRAAVVVNGVGRERVEGVGGLRRQVQQRDLVRAGADGRAPFVQGDAAQRRPSCRSGPPRRSRRP